ncbi:tetratricopeptide repeat protein [Acetobacter okinawensis]|uniref:tetratricopeptide repeat protein n=1 Tax=Acetobacter okinawensis TaxID=1076594 RepID=UPI001BAC2732|nr:tetratricopeptide repeat protein [Acetobacter okinawensis]MBS0966418.1 tetratricopeptide repeat protein [Acetobacter okinawensis]MBS0989244.1 tetratricopeptide repeat protein [Acetobacter okinawensis]
MKAAFSTRRSLPCMLAGAVVLAGTSSMEGVAQARTQQVSGEGKQVWSATTCMAMIGDDPYGARDYALDWQHHGGGRDARHCHALALLEAGDEDTAARELDELAHQTAQKGDSMPPALRAIMEEEAAEAWLAAGVPAKAQASADFGLSVQPGNQGLQVARARSLLAQNRADLAEQELTALVTRQPGTAPEAYIMLAEAERKMGRLEQAMQHITHALGVAPENAAALLERGIIRERKGDAAGARQDWQKVLDLSPDSHEADMARQDLAVMAADPDSP